MLDSTIVRTKWFSRSVCHYVTTLFVRIVGSLAKSSLQLMQEKEGTFPVSAGHDNLVKPALGIC